MKKSLTDDQATKLKPKENRFDVKDTKVIGLQMRVSPNWKKVWRIRVWQGGTSVSETIGIFKHHKNSNIEMSSDDARGEAKQRLAALGRLGKAKQAEVAFKAIPRLEEWWEKFKAANPNRWEPRTMKDNTTRMTEYVLPRLGKKRLHKIKSRDLEDLVSDVEKKVSERAAKLERKANGARTANMCLRVVSILLNWAESREEMPPDWKKPKAKKASENRPSGKNLVPRHRYDDLVNALDEFRNRRADLDASPPIPPNPHDGTLADLVLMALFTGQRKGNVKAMRWDQISELVWTIPIEQMKQRRTAKEPLRVPLIPPALVVLKERRAAAGDSPWVFPSPKTDGHVVLDRMVWNYVRDKLGLDSVTFHGLRHSLGTWMGQSGSGQKMIGDALGHSTSATTDTYVHPDEEARRESMSRAIPGEITADFEVFEESPKPDQITLSRDLVERAIRSVRSAKVREELQAALDNA